MIISIGNYTRREARIFSSRNRFALLNCQSSFIYVLLFQLHVDVVEQLALANGAFVFCFLANQTFSNILFISARVNTLAERNTFF